MHGTGTPLGDPIEVGALASAFRSQPSAAHAPPLVPMASKSWVGHAEPAAGFIGMAHAVAAASHRAALAQLHLRTLNPHVSEAVTLRSGGGEDGYGAAAPWLLPRSGGAAPMQDGAASVRTSVSAFAFQVYLPPKRRSMILTECRKPSAGIGPLHADQCCVSEAHVSASQGTNAVVVLEASAPAATSKRPFIWRRGRFWAAPVAHVALQVVAAAGHNSVQLEARFRGAASANLQDHRCLSPVG